jgi:hypothetical protein
MEAKSQEVHIWCVVWHTAWQHSSEGIQPNPEKVKAVMKMKPPKYVKDI